MSVKTLVIAIVALAFNFGISQDAFAQGKGKAKGHYKHANKKAVKKNKHDKDFMYQHENKPQRRVQVNHRQIEQARVTRQQQLQREQQIQRERQMRADREMQMERERQAQVQRQRQMEQAQPAGGLGGGLEDILGGLLGGGALNGVLGNGALDGILGGGGLNDIF